MINIYLAKNITGKNENNLEIFMDFHFILNAINSNFSIPIYLQPDDVNLLYF